MDINNKQQTIETLFNAKAYLGHKRNRVHPGAKKYIYTYRNNNSIIDLEKTYHQILTVKEEIEKIKKKQEIILFVSTKNLLAETIKKISQENSFPYLVNKWPAGFFTNFDSIAKNIKKLNEMVEEQKNGHWEKFPKHEQLKLSRQLNKLKRVYEGVTTLFKLPDAIFIIDFKKEKNAFDEAKKMKIKTFGICDTNFNPDLVDYPVVANDDLLSSVEIILKLLLE